MTGDSSGYEDSRVVVSDKLNVVGRQVLTHDCSPVVTGGVVPGSVNDGHAGLLSQSSSRGEAVRLRETLGTSLGPLVDSDDPDTVSVEANRPVGGQHLDEGGGPEPAVDVERLIVWGVTAIHLGVTQAAGSPELLDAGTSHESRHPVPLLLVLEGDQVHAVFPAVVPGCEPIPLGFPQDLLIALPAEPVVLPLELSGADLVLPDGAILSVRQANLAAVTVWVDVQPGPVLGQRHYDGFSSPRVLGGHCEAQTEAGHHRQQQSDR